MGSELGWQIAADGLEEASSSNSTDGGEERMSMCEPVCGVDVHRDSLVATVTDGSLAKAEHG